VEKKDMYFSQINKEADENCECHSEPFKEKPIAMTTNGERVYGIKDGKLIKEKPLSYCCPKCKTDEIFSDKECLCDCHPTKTPEVDWEEFIDMGINAFLTVSEKWGEYISDEDVPLLKTHLTKSYRNLKEQIQWGEDIVLKHK
jgi:hypothetical protein